MRARYPEVAARWQIALHAISLVCSLFTIGVLAYCTVQFKQNLVLTYLVTCCATLWNIYELVALSGHRQRFWRLYALLVGLVESFIFLMCIVSVGSVLLAVPISVNGKMDSPDVKFSEFFVVENWRNIVVGLQAGIGLSHLLLSVFAWDDSARNK
ncbi:hypothetical protein BDV95DRAFT_575572 [Massariosphaeria phaeospora]|uniref:Transmembrane protein n=1 Tax=Massariosphaeria phaeospora TaxID=100035 RepID=A0A7C8I412_9PLEO|nr:hypothetical protein BDV95DRAFT_575572 [Massariosphaeria phaeospora]